MNTSEIAGELLRRLGMNASETEIGMLFSVDTEWNIPGDTNAFPWIGKKEGRDVVESFVRDTRRLLEPLDFVVDGIMSDHRRAVILGSLASTVRATGKNDRDSIRYHRDGCGRPNYQLLDA